MPDKPPCRRHQAAAAPEKEEERRGEAGLTGEYNDVAPPISRRKLCGGAGI